MFALKFNIRVSLLAIAFVVILLLSSWERLPTGEYDLELLEPVHVGIYNSSVNFSKFIQEDPLEVILLLLLFFS